MSWFTGIIVYLLIWWVVIFTTLPLYIERDKNGPEISGPGAPKDPRLKQKFILTSVIASIIWLFLAALIQSELISFRSFALQS